MGEAKRRKTLGLPPREKPIEFPKFDKESVQKKVRATLYKFPIILKPPAIPFSPTILVSRV